MATEVYDFEGNDPSQDVGGGQPDHIPAPGPYEFRIAKHERRRSKSSGNDMIEWVLECTSPGYSGATVYDYFSKLAPEDGRTAGKRRWHAVLLVLGAKVQPGVPFKLDTDMLSKFTLVATVKDRRREERVADDGTVYPASTYSVIDKYIGAKVNGKAIGQATAAPAAKAAPKKSEPEPEPEPELAGVGASAAEAVDESVWGS